MAQLPNLTRSDVAQPVYVFAEDGNALKFKYILPNNSVGKRSVLVESLQHARMINSLLAMKLHEGGLVKKATFTSTPLKGAQHDLIVVEYKDEAAAVVGRAMHEDEILNLAANVNADGSLKNPDLSVWPVTPPLPTTEEFVAMVSGEIGALKQKHPSLSFEEIGNMAKTLSIVKIFASKTSKAHGGDVKIHEFPKNGNGELKVEFTKACVNCISGRELTRTNLEKMAAEYTRGYIRKITLV